MYFCIALIIFIFLLAFCINDGEVNFYELTVVRNLTVIFTLAFMSLIWPVAVISGIYKYFKG